MKVSIVIPNYNGEGLLKENLPKVLTAAKQYEVNTKNTVEVIVVDDFSTDNSMGLLEKMRNVHVLQNDKNLGFTSTVNRGVGEAEGEIIVLLNTDVVPERNFLQPLVKHFANEKVFAVGCMDKSVEKGKVVLRGRGVGRWEKGFLVHARGEVDKTDTLWVAGGSGAFRKSIWEKLGGFDTLYSPFYWEDIDLSYRALKAGYKILFEPASVVAHRHEEGVIKKMYPEALIRRISYRNQFIFVWKNTTDPYLILSHLLWLPYHVGRAVATQDVVFLSGLQGAIILLPKILHSRFLVKKHFVRSDRDVVRKFMQ